MEIENLRYLLEALGEQDLKKVRRCMDSLGVEDLNIEVKGQRCLRSLLCHCIKWEKKDEFVAIMAMKDKINLHKSPCGYAPIHYAAFREDPIYLHLLIASGADISMHCAGANLIFNALSLALVFTGAPKALMLLSVGADPICNIPENIKVEVRRWLDGLRSAKNILTSILDNPTLENEICSFVYNETFLVKAIRS